MKNNNIYIHVIFPIRMSFLAKPITALPCYGHHVACTKNNGCYINLLSWDCTYMDSWRMI